MVDDMFVEEVPAIEPSQTIATYEGEDGVQWIGHRIGMTPHDAKPFFGRHAYFDTARSRLVYTAKPTQELILPEEKVGPLSSLSLPDLTLTTTDDASDPGNLRRLARRI